MSPLTKNQWKSVAKAIGYAFVSTFVTTLLVQPEISQATLYASAVAGVNAILVVIKKLFTVEE